MRVSRFTNEQLAIAADVYRRLAISDLEANPESNIRLAEVFEELLDHRLRLGHAEN